MQGELTIEQRANVYRVFGFQPSETRRVHRVHLSNPEPALPLSTLVFGFIGLLVYGVFFHRR